MSSIQEDCIFCNKSNCKVISSSKFFFIIRDTAYPVTKHHTLIISNRHVDDFFNLTKDEMNDLDEVLKEQKKFVSKFGSLNKTKAKILWDLKLGITAKDFTDGKLEDYYMVQELKKQLHHVGEGTEESRTFKDAITLEEVPREFILSFETDGSMTPRIAFDMATKELAGRFNAIEEDSNAVF